MSDIKIDSTNDIVIESNDLVLTTGKPAIDQHLGQRLRTWFGEWFLNRRIGIPYVQQVLKKNPDAVIVDSVFKKEIINTLGVLELLEFGLDINSSTRQLTVPFKAKTSEGVVTFDEVLP